MPLDENGNNVTLKEFIQSLLKEHDRYFTSRIDAIEKSINVAREVLQQTTTDNKIEIDRRLLELNKLREEVIQDRSQLLLRPIYDSFVKEISTWKDDVNKKLTTLETRAITWTAAIAILFMMTELGIRWFGK